MVNGDSPLGGTGYQALVMFPDGCDGHPAQERQAGRRDVGAESEDAVFVSTQYPYTVFRVAEIDHHLFDLKGQIDSSTSCLWIGDGKFDGSLKTPQLGAMHVDDGSYMARTRIDGSMGQRFAGWLDRSIGP